jgi:hypothetical protein
MARANIVYRVATEKAGFAALKGFAEGLSATSDRAWSRDEVWADSFDWRLHRGGARISFVRQEEGSAELLWSDLDSETLQRLPAVSLPNFADELPTGRFRRELIALLKRRRLLPVAEIQRVSHELRLINSRAKTVARVALELGTVKGMRTSDSEQALPVLIRLLPVRGYRKALRKLKRFAQRELGLQPLKAGEFELVLGLIDRQPGDVPPLAYQH